MSDYNAGLFKSQEQMRQHLVGNYCALEDWMRCCPRSKTMQGYSERLACWVLISITCKNWGCPICGRKKVAHYARKVEAAEPNRFITLTINPAMWSNPREAYDGTRRAVPKFAAAIRKVYGEFEFFRVLEVTKKGWPHYHLVTRSAYLPQPELSRLWKELTGAPIVDVRQIKKRQQVYFYVVKYLAKQEVIPWTDRRTSHTRKFFREKDWEPAEGLGLLESHFIGHRADQFAKWNLQGCTLQKYSDTCWIIKGITSQQSDQQEEPQWDGSGIEWKPAS